MVTARLDVQRPDAGWLRLVRAGVLGVSAVLLAAGAHLAGGGGAPNAAALVLAACVAGLVAVSVTARRCRLPLLLTILGLEQSGLHLLFTYAAAAGGCGPSVMSAVGHVGHGAASCQVMAADHAMAEPGLVMVLAHVAAVMATAWLLARGEQWLWGLVTAVAVSTASRPSRRRTRLARLVPGSVLLPAGWQLAGLAPTRGPPQG